MRIAEAQLVRAAGELQRAGELQGGELIQAFVGLLRRKRYARRVGKIMRALDVYAEQESGVLSITATSAHPLPASERQSVSLLAPQLLQKPGRKAVIEFHEDATLLGGIRLDTADTRYDGTVARALKELRKSL